MEKEIWKDIPNFEGFYQCSNLGNVKRLERKYFYLNKQKTFKEKILKQSKNTKGYLFVTLFCDGLRKSFMIHSLVMMTFCNHKNSSKIVVDHIDNNKLNNKLNNLQIITQRLNASKDRLKKSNYTGVYWRKDAKRWQSLIYINKKHIHLGYFKTEDEAVNAYKNALKKC
jgi:hypothetical protein